jgi:hypothetical protein
VQLLPQPVAPLPSPPSCGNILPHAPAAERCSMNV